MHSLVDRPTASRLTAGVAGASSLLIPAPLLCAGLWCAGQCQFWSRFCRQVLCFLLLAVFGVLASTCLACVVAWTVAEWVH